MKSTNRTLNEWRDILHGLAREKGWYDIEEGVGQFTTRTINNIHGEISEAWEAHRAGKLDQPCDKAEKMKALGLRPLTCLEEEVADIVIRSLDSIGFFGWDARCADSGAIANSFRDFVRQLHALTTGIGAFPERGLCQLLDCCLQYSKTIDLDLWECVEIKHQYNKSRSYRHGGKVA